MPLFSVRFKARASPSLPQTTFLYRKIKAPIIPALLLQFSASDLAMRICIIRCQITAQVRANNCLATKRVLRGHGNTHPNSALILTNRFRKESTRIYAIQIRTGKQPIMSVAVAFFCHVNWTAFLFFLPIMKARAQKVFLLSLAVTGKSDFSLFVGQLSSVTKASKPPARKKSSIAFEGTK